MKTLTTIKVYKNEVEKLNNIKKIISEKYNIKLSNEDILKHILNENIKSIEKSIIMSYNKELEEVLKMNKELLKTDTKTDTKKTTSTNPTPTK